MRYYYLSRSDNLNIIGHYPQTKLRKGYNPRLSDSHWQVKKYEFPDFIPKLELELHKNAIPTDYLHFINLNHGLIVSKKMKETLEKFQLPRHHFYPISVYHKGNLLDYYWMHYIIDDFWDLLNNTKSYAEIKKMIDPITFSVESKVPILSREQIINEKYSLEHTKIIVIGNIEMKTTFPNYDFYQIDCLSYNNIISQSLKESIIYEGLTGFEAKPYDKFSVEPCC